MNINWPNYGISGEELQATYGQINHKLPLHNFLSYRLPRNPQTESLVRSGPVAQGTQTEESLDVSFKGKSRRFHFVYFLYEETMFLKCILEMVPMVPPISS